MPPMHEDTVTGAEPAAHVGQRIRGLVHELSALAREDRPPLEFFTEFLHRLVAALGAPAGAVWLRTDDDGLELQSELQLDRALGLPHVARRAWHDALLAETIDAGQPRLAALPLDIEDGRGGSNPSPLVLAVAPIAADAVVLGVVEVAQPPGSSTAAQEGFLRFLSQVALLAGDYCRSRQGRELSEQRQLWGRLGDFAAAAHRSLDVQPTAFAIANDGRVFLECDRLSVAVRHGRKYRLLAVSGQDAIERRANSVRRLEELVRIAAAGGEPLWHGGEQVERPPQVDEALHEYLDESHARAIGIVPLFPPAEREKEDGLVSRRRSAPLGALIVEQFDGRTSQAALQARGAAAAEHAALALHNALTYHSLFLLPLWKFLGRLSWLVRARTLPKTLLAVAALVAAVTALFVVPGDFKLEARGRLEPRIRREIFARADGFVREVHAAHGQKVEAEATARERGEPLLTLRSPDMEYRLATVLGELQTADSKLAAANAGLLTSDRSGAEGRAKQTQLAAEIEQLNSQRKSLQERYALLTAQEQDLAVYSPIQGQVTTWQVEDLLASRPVQRGQALLTVADTDGPWVVELLVPDRRIGHVRAAQAELQPDLEVSFILATDPSVTYRGRIADVALSAEVDDEQGNSVLVTVAIDRETIPALRPGASVVANIHCGRRRIGYVWFHEVFEFVQGRVLFKFL